MNKYQFLVLLTAFLPLINLIVVKNSYDRSLIAAKINKIIPVVFFLSLIIIHNDFQTQFLKVNFLNVSSDLFLGFKIDNIGFAFLLLLNLIWLCLVFYLDKFFLLANVKKPNEIVIYLITVFACINLVFLSANFLTTIIFYYFLIAIAHFFIVKFLYKSSDKSSKFLTAIFYLQAAIFFIVVVANIKFSSNSNLFVNSSILKDRFILLFFLLSLFFLTIIPCYIFLGKINLNPLFIYIFFFLIYALPGLYIVIRLFLFVFDVDILAKVFSKTAFSFFELLFLINISIQTVLLMFNKSIKANFFYILLLNLTNTIFATVLLATYNPKVIIIPTISFALNMSLFLLLILNIFLFSKNQKDQDSLSGLFHYIKITVLLVVFVVAAMLGLAPSISMVEKFYIFKYVIGNKLYIYLLGLIIYCMAIFTFIYRYILEFFSKDKIKLENVHDDEDLSVDIDYDSNLILTPICISIASLMLLVFFPLLITIIK